MKIIDLKNSYKVIRSIMVAKLAQQIIKTGAYKTRIFLLIILIVFSLKAKSQTDTIVSKKLDLEEVIVSAQKAPVIYSRLSRLVSTIDNKEIKQMPVLSLAELLENFSGVDIRQRGVNGVQADISIRGGSFDQNLILLNGINITDPQTGHHSLNLPVDLNSVERIEVLEGSGSRVFGPNAFSGAINIITNQSEENYSKVGFMAGDFGLFSGNVASSFKHKNMKQFISASKSQSNGYAKNTDYGQYNLFYNTQYKSEVGQVDFQVGYSDKEFGAYSFYTPKYPDQFEQTKATFASLKFETGEKIKLIPAIYYRRHKDRFELFRDEPASWYTGHNYHLTDVYGIKLDSRISSKLGVTSFGAELRSENIWSNVLGEPMNDTIKVKGEPDGLYTRKYSRTLANYFLEHSFVLGRFSFSSGILASWVSENNFDFNIYPGLDLSYAFFKQAKAYFTINKSLRLPTFTDLFYSGPSNIGNPGLKPEEAWSYEFGTKINTKIVNANVSVYYRDAKDVIEWVRPINASPDTKWETQNLTRVKTKGFSFYTKFEIKKYSLNTISVNYNYLDQNASADTFETKYSLNYLKHNLILNINQQLIKNFTLSWNVKYQDRVGGFDEYNYSTNSSLGYKEFKPFWLLDARLNWNYKSFLIYAEATNIFNSDYDDVGNIQMPGRWFKSGFVIKIDY